MTAKIAIRFGFPTSDVRMEDIEIEAENHDLDLYGGWNHFMMGLLPGLLTPNSKGSYFDMQFKDLLGEDMLPPKVTFDTYLKNIGSQSVRLPSYILEKDYGTSIVTGKQIKLTDENMQDWCDELCIYLDINEVSYERFD